MAPDSRSLEDLLGQTDLEVRTDSEFGWRGEAFVRMANGWLSIPAALPDEVVRVAVEDEIGRGQRTFARLLEVVEPAPDRVPSHCDRVDMCRGCQLRTASADLEAKFKDERILELLAKFGDLEGSNLPKPERIGSENARNAGYRWRSSLSYRAETASLGLVSGASAHLIGMSDCPSLVPSTRRLVGEIERVFESIDPKIPGPSGGANGLRSVLVEAGTPPRIVLRPASPHSGSAARFERATDALHAAIPDATVAIELDHGHAHVHGAEWLTVPYRARGMSLDAKTGAWTHATVGPPEELYETIHSWFTRHGASRHLDVGCGIGAVSLVAASAGGSSVGIDHSRAATESAARNAERHQLDATFVTADWEKGLRDLAIARQRFETATLNPMREPVGGRVIDYLTELGVERLFFLGPSPEASGRDFAELRRAGWTLSRLLTVDLHPASYQVMVGAEWRFT